MTVTRSIDDGFERLPLASDHLCSIEVDAGPVVSLGNGPYGERRYVAIVGGRVDGIGMQGIVVPGGTDWQVARADGVIDIEAHYSLLLDDGARVEVRSQGVRYGPAEVLQRLARGEDVDPSTYFFRTFIRFQTGAPRLAELNRTMAIAIGARRAATVELTVHRLR